MLFPPRDKVIFLDIETDINMSKVWLIGCLVNSKEYQFIAKNFSKEKAIMVEFQALLEAYPNYPLVCYSTTNFDFRVLFNVARRLKMYNFIQQMQSRSLIDLGTLLRRHFEPFGKSYSLKVLRYLIGYKYKDEGIFGGDIALKYYIETKKYGQISSEFEKVALEYNLDDIRIIDYIISKFEDHIDFVPDFLSIDRTPQDFASQIHSYNINPRFIRISCKNEDASTILPKLMSLGMPLPQVNEGVNITAFYWKSQFAYKFSSKVIDQLNLGSTNKPEDKLTDGYGA